MSSTCSTAVDYFDTTGYESLDPFFQEVLERREKVSQKEKKDKEKKKDKN